MKSKNPRTLVAHGIKIQKHNAAKPDSIARSPCSPGLAEPKKSIRLVKRNRTANNTEVRVTERDMLVPQSDLDYAAAVQPVEDGKIRISL